ncbi:DNA primase [Phytophthora cinnamomi]|uniref:DNA primase n=1 Tax=Phytophthora cinnamomi TaxID=4785 RepID=UPI003559E2A8|nr:DNA primase [Phytophthora cinnamomi]
MRRRRASSSGGGDPDAFFRLPCALLVEFLDLREAINLLNASRWLRSDRVLSATALEKTRYAQHFHQKCAADWWHLTPAWKAGERLAESDWDEDEDADVDVDAADAAAPDVWQDCHVRTAAGKELTYWRDTVRDTPQWQHVPLLSIIDFMVTKLLPQSYISFKYAATVYTARPVIVRLHPPESSSSSGDRRRGDGQDAAEQHVARRISDALGAQNGKLTSLFGLHWENMRVDPDSGEVTCAVCQLYADEVGKYQTKVAEMVSDWRETVKRELPAWKAQGMHQMEIDRRTYEMREEMIPYSGFFTSNVARRHGDIIIRHICSYWTTLDHLKINTLGYRDASQLVTALTSDIRKQCQHFSKIKQAMSNAFPRVARIRYKVDEPEPSPPTSLWQEEAVTELVAGVSPSGFLCGMLFIEKSV